MANIVKNAGAREDFIARLNQLGASMQEALKNKVVQIVDFSMYSARDIKSDTTVELMQSSDTKKVGITNVNNRKLGANEYALFKGMQLLKSAITVSDDAQATDAQVAGANYGVIDQTIANGELEIKQGDRILMPRSSCEVFRTSTYSDGLVGYYAFDCPKMMSPLTDIIPTLYLPAAVSTSTSHIAVKCVFHGVKTNKA